MHRCAQQFAYETQRLPLFERRVWRVSGRVVHR